VSLDGLVVVDKPPGWTSHDVVAKCRKLLGTKKVGHSGTLDPDATGILLVGVGRVTRLLRFLTALPKTYTCEIVFGSETSTLDASGDVTAEHRMDELTPAHVAEAARGLTGEIMQVPPMVSAVKIEGRRLHQLAREGVEVERQARPVVVHRFALVPTTDPMVYRAEVECSSGTYIRTLAADLGTALGGGAHLRDLRRTAIGSFDLDHAVTLEAVSPDVLLAPADALRDYPALVVDDGVAVDVSHGRTVAIPESGPDLGGRADVPIADVWRVLDRAGRLLGVYQGPPGQRASASVVLTPAGQ
jgi:tRNA pseudouridine55 synthase